MWTKYCWLLSKHVIVCDVMVLWIWTMCLFCLCDVTYPQSDLKPRPCSDNEPIYLTELLTSFQKQLPAGIQIEYEDSTNTHAFTLTDTAAYLGFPATTVFKYCDIFPEKFSLLITFKVSHKTALRDESIINLVPLGSSEAKFGVGFSKGIIKIFYWDRISEKVKELDFDIGEAFDQVWHTLVVMVSGDRVSLTLDCGVASRTKFMKTYPALLNIRHHYIHVGNGNSGVSSLFTGKLKEIVFLSGADITPIACPTSPAVISIDNSVMSQQNIPFAANKNPTYDEVCSWRTTGHTWFDIRDKTLKVCYSGIWQPILPPPGQREKVEKKHLDYFVWHQDIITAAPAIDIEVFNIPNEGLFMATASFDSRNMKKTQSAIFKWTAGSFKLYQSLYTYGAQAFEHFMIENQFFLAVANTGVDSAKPSISVIYRWNKKRKRFRIHQELVTWTARDIEHFQIEDIHYLIVANHRMGENHTINSVLYRMQPKDRMFEPYQNITTTGAYDMTHFSVDGYHFLVAANSFSGPPIRTTRVESMVYFWRQGRFLAFQSIQTCGATDFEFFRVQSELYLAVANAYEYGMGAPQTHSTISVIYKLDELNKRFKVYQEVETHSIIDWEAFQIGEDTFLVGSNAQHNSTAPSVSTVYRWQGVEKFVPVHHLATRPSADWEAFTADGDTYIAYANADENISQIFKAKLR